MQALWRAIAREGKRHLLQRCVRAGRAETDPGSLTRGGLTAPLFVPVSPRAALARLASWQKAPACLAGAFVG